jgi:hypothetical protein
MPHKSSIPIFWRLKEGKYNLIGTRCASCDIDYFPPRTLCPKCGRSNLEPRKIEENGTIVTYTIIRVAPDGFEAPYCVAIIALNGTMITGQVVGDINKIKVGGAVRAVLRKIYETEDGLINYGFKFELVEK